MTIIERIVSPLGRRIDEASPLVDARLADGSRVNAIVPPLSLIGPCVTIRKFTKNPLSIDNLVGFGTLSEEMAEFLEACVKARLNIMVSGGTGSGKTEAFLLPLLAQLFKEAKTWQKVSNDPNWFDRRNTVYSPCQRENDTNEKGRHYPALRALIMYPMNALVSDQVSRLRRLIGDTENRFVVVQG